MSTGSSFVLDKKNGNFDFYDQDLPKRPLFLVLDVTDTDDIYLQNDIFGDTRNQIKTRVNVNLSEIFRGLRCDYSNQGHPSKFFAS